uniref:Uncharacterized protein n=1 Tax=Megaselia scalaris TaxID=36166 RepID=T1GIN0_MEGSC
MPSQTSFDVETTGFADFTKFSEEVNECNSKPSTATPPRPTVSSIQSNQRVSAFEVYKKPTITPRSSQSPVELRQALPPPQIYPPSLDYEKKVSAINETLRNLEQNSLLLRLCHDLSEELLSVQHRKEEIRSKLETASGVTANSGATSTSIVNSGGITFVTANSTGGSGGSASMA